jgi:hypothetical protein
MENAGMTTQEAKPTPADVMADLEAVLLHIGTGGVEDPELLKRIDERSKAIRERVFNEHGVLEVAVDLIRETRDE